MFLSRVRGLSQLMATSGFCRFLCSLLFGQASRRLQKIHPRGLEGIKHEISQKLNPELPTEIVTTRISVTSLRPFLNTMAGHVGTEKVQSREPVAEKAVT